MGRSHVAERSIREFEAAFAVESIADAWASANGFGLSRIEQDGSRLYVRGSGLLTGQMMCVVRQAGTHVSIEAYVHARLVARLGALFLIPENQSIEAGGFKGALPRKICREAVDKLLAQLGQPPISASDNADAPQPFAGPAGAAPTADGAVASPAIGARPGFDIGATRSIGVIAVAVVEVVTAVICFTVFPQYLNGFSSQVAYDHMERAAVCLGMSLSYLALTGACVAVAWRLWSMRRDAWPAAILLSVAMIAITIVAWLIDGFEEIGVVGIVVHGAVLVYLNLAPVRALFGRAPLATTGS